MKNEKSQNTTDTEKSSEPCISQQQIRKFQHCQQNCSKFTQYRIFRN